MRQQTGSVTPADATVTGGALGWSTPTGVVPGGWKPSGLAVSEVGPSLVGDGGGAVGLDGD